MDKVLLNLLLADDDADDCMLFRDVLDELPVESSLKTVHDGEQLMHLLTTRPDMLPDVLFLDLNMPRKNGVECLTEIKVNEQLKALPVVIYSTSLDRDVVNLLCEKGAQYYIRKPGNFSTLKNMIHKALKLTTITNGVMTPKEHFVIQG